MMSEGRHPEWNLMYRAGLSFGRISALCHAPVSTVHRHLQQRTLADPSLLDDYRTNRVSDAVRVPGKVWLHGMEELKVFVTAARRDPGGSGRTRDEQVLGAWLGGQRRWGGAATSARCSWSDSTG